MLRDELLMTRYAARLDRLCELAEKEVERTRHEPPFRAVAEFYREHFGALREAFNDHLPARPRRRVQALPGRGFLEIITCGATHGFLPLMQATPQAVRAQISIAASHYRHAFGRDPTGIWLAECGYFPGVERFLASEGIRYFFVDTHGIADATPRPVYGVYAPIYTEPAWPRSGATPSRRQQVWSAETGYPGDPVYREFYRDIGYDLDLDYVRPYIQPTGDRKNTGIKYYRITGKTAHKELYDPKLARERAEEHAGNFLFNRERQVEHLAVGDRRAQADRRRALRRRALRPLVVRGAVVPRGADPQDGVRPGRGPARHPERLPRRAAREPGRHPADVAPGARGATRRSGSTARTTGSTAHLHQAPSR